MKIRISGATNWQQIQVGSLALHNIITRNISENYHAYTYIKPKIKKNNCQIDIKTLQARCHNRAMQDVYINEARKMLETLSYRNERATQIVVCNSKFQNVVNILDSYGRSMHKKYVVELLWNKLNTTELAMFLASVKVNYCRNRQKYTDILQENCHPYSNWKTPPFKRLGYWNSKR